MPRRTTTTRPPYIPAEQTNENNLNDIEKTPQLVGPFLNVRTTTSSTTTTPAPPVNLVSPIAPNGLVFTGNAYLSNGDLSRQTTGAAGINDFSIFNDYIHSVNSSTTATSSVIKFNPSSLLQRTVTRFEVYKKQFRTTSTTTTVAPIAPITTVAPTAPITTVAPASTTTTVAPISTTTTVTPTSTTTTVIPTTTTTTSSPTAIVVKWSNRTIKVVIEKPLIAPINPRGEVLNDYEEIHYRYARPNAIFKEGNGKLLAGEGTKDGIDIFPGLRDYGKADAEALGWPANTTYLFEFIRFTFNPRGLIKSYLRYRPITVTTGSDNCPILSCVKQPSSAPAIEGNTVTFRAKFKLDWPHEGASIIRYEWRYYQPKRGMMGIEFDSYEDPVLSTNESLTVTISHVQALQAIWWGEAPFPGYYAKDPRATAWQIGYECRAYLHSPTFDFYPGCENTRVTSSPAFLYDPNKPRP
jgi:hypothetical protein